MRHVCGFSIEGLEMPNVLDKSENMRNSGRRLRNLVWWKVHRKVEDGWNQ